jgi:hypothetical protein
MENRKKTSLGVDYQNLPFDEIINNNTSVRIFKQDVEPKLLVWHRDKEDRIIEATHETNWMFQKDNELPINFDKKIFIEKMVWHRVIKGDGDLELKIKKLI